MAAIDDAATVLETFCQDGELFEWVFAMSQITDYIAVSNLPAEIAHLLEEIHAKDTHIMQCRDTISNRDSQLQRNIRQHGTSSQHPKEDAFVKTVLSNYDRVETLQAEKLALSEKAMLLVSEAAYVFTFANEH